jgi:hypothetical protein
VADKKWNKTNNSYEITFGSETVVEEVSDSANVAMVKCVKNSPRISSDVDTPADSTREHLILPVFKSFQSAATRPHHTATPVNSYHSHDHFLAARVSQLIPIRTRHSLTTPPPSSPHCHPHHHTTTLLTTPPPTLITTLPPPSILVTGMTTWTLRSWKA